MSAASSSTTGGRRRIRTPGIPSRCWCGVGVTEIISRSNPNPYRRYYRCLFAASQRVHPFVVYISNAYESRLLVLKKNHVVARERQSCLQMGWRSLHRWDTAAGLPSSNARRRSSESQSNNKEWRRYPRRSQKDAHDKDIRRLCSSYHRFSCRNYDVQKVIEIPKRIPIPITNCYC